MGGRLNPPPWSAVGSLLEDAAILYAVLFGVAIATLFTARSSALRFIRDLLLLWKATAACWLFALYVVAASVRHAFALTVVRIFFSTVVCILYVYVTYLGYIPVAVRAFQFTLGVVLLTRFACGIIGAPNPIAFMLHIESFMEALSLSSLIYASDRVWLHFSFLQAIAVLSRYFEVEPVLEAMMVQKTSPFRRQLARLTLEFIVFIYIFACGLQLFEVLGDPTESLTATTFELTLANSLYFTVVTIFTVGYGDFVPYTLFGRLWIIFIIVFGAYLVSRKIGQVIDVVSGLRRGMGAFVKDEDVDHCVLCGNVKWEYLKTFVQEFFADVGNQNTKIVVMCDQSNWSEDLWNSFFTSDTEFKDNVVYLEGACMMREDLLRAQVETALAVFVLNNQHDPQPYLEDSETLKRILSVRAFAPNLPIYSMCALRDSMLQITVALEHDDEDLAPNAMHTPRAGTAARSGSFGKVAADVLMNPSAGTDNSAFDGFGRDLYGGGDIDDTVGLAETGYGTGGPTIATPVSPNRGGVAPGGIQSAYSVDFSDEDDDDDFMVISDYDGMSDLKSDAICMQEVEMSLLAENVFCNGLSTLLSNLVLNVLPQTKATDRPWMVEYKIGAECRMAYVKLPMELHGKRFSEIAIALYDYGILLLATKRFSDVKWRTITPDTVIHLNTIGLVVTFHSANFIDTVMQHAAQYLLQKNLEESVSPSGVESSSQSVPSVDGDDSDGVGDLMTGSGDVDAASPDLAATTKSSGSRLDSAHQENQSHTRNEDETLAMSPPDVRLKNVGVTGLTAEGARLSDTDVGDDRLGPGLLPEGRALHISRERQNADNLVSIPSLPARSASVADISKGCHVTSGQMQGMSNSGDQRSMAVHLDPSVDQDHDERATALGFVSPDGRSGLMAPPFSHSEKVSGAQGNAAGDASSTHINDSVPVRVGREGSRVSFPESLPVPKRRHSAFAATSFTDASKSESAHKVGKRKADKSSSDDMEMVFFGDAPIPVRLKGHIVVCVIGQMGLVNLKHFLHRVWMRRRGFKRETPVVAICPKITDAVEDDIALFSSNKLYVVQGNSLNITTLKRAQYDRARAIVVLACEDKNDVDHMDAKAIFTVMTLDYMLGERSNTFVCTMIDAEESMKLLRAPAHARRRGANLGRATEEFYDSFGRTIQSPGPGRSLSSLGASQSFMTSVLPARAGLSCSTNTSLPMPIPGSSVLHLPESSADGSESEHPKPFTQRLLPRANTSTSLGAASLSSFAENHSSLVPPSPAYVGNLTNQWSNRSAALHQIVTGESNASVGSDTRLNTSRAVSFLGFSGDGTSRGPNDSTQLSASLGGGTSPALRQIHPSVSFGGSIPGNSGCVPALAAGTPSFLRALEGDLHALDGDVSMANLQGVSGNAREAEPPSDGRKRSRGELFERQRYASGEMMISSVYVALLIREFAMPGIMSVVRKIFGVGVGKNSRSKKCWIRTMKVPASWVASGLNGERTYRELFITLLGFSCIPLGLYRSGRADVRVQLAVEGLEDGEDIGESHPLLSDADDGRPRIGSFTCPTTGHKANFEQIPGGENVLPYVYTNPEAYTLISEHDAVYILAHPLLKIPDVWGD